MTEKDTEMDAAEMVSAVVYADWNASVAVKCVAFASLYFSGLLFLHKTGTVMKIGMYNTVLILILKSTIVIL